MTIPSNDQIRVLAKDAAAVALLEVTLLRLARRLKEGRAKPRRRWVSRTAGVVLSELAAEGAAEVYWQRRRMRAAFEQRLAAASVNGPVPALGQLPQQRTPQRSHAGVPSS